jgi:hypothetical protein
VEVVAVQAHVEHVEGAHRCPGVLGREGERGDLLALHVLQEGVEVGPGRGGGPAVLLEDRLPVEHGPRVVLDRHEVLLAVGGGRRLLERVAEAVDRPDVADVADEAVLGELRHAVAGKPGEDVVGRALQVGVDALLEGVVVNGVGANAAWRAW